MALKLLRHEDLSDSQIVQRCADPHRQLVSTTPQVVKLSDDVVVKFGLNVTAEETSNQTRAFELLDQAIIRVPKVYRYFNVYGEEESPNDAQIEKTAQILKYFSTIEGERPGPLKGGISRGLLWRDNGKPDFGNVQQMERWLNARLPDVDAKLRLEQYPLVLCHLDLAPRNFVWLADGSVCLLDWCSAGFYPRFFEVCMLKIMEYTHGTYELDLIERMIKLSDDEEEQMKLLQRSFYNGIRYSFPNIHQALE
ncbi:hypothetical protein L207DRAFT_574439 [Hyaloscypha variabilis F]|uniref:Aminoglycoside phosphotransferase domain-containing protein n=1 Tax=Hyaloscypha variabilis (strain UAMH 11265 / GT02V1 / F) TaxID=1149755 RepID=A0A2J6QSC6_HYAVF|nr:hypothetical protein L207DRAFT_574439 [Hyaloscypha variabilis F]